MKAVSGLRGKALFWLGASALLVCWGPLAVAEDAGGLADLGEHYRAAGDTAGLAAVEKKLADMKTDRPAALLALGRLLHAEEKDVEAVSVLEQALALKPDDFETESELGLVYKALGQYGKAARVMEKALKKRPQENMLTVEVGICYVRMGRLERAKAAFARAKRINGKAYYKAYIAQGYAYLDAGHDAQARREFESLIAVDTASPLGYHHMGVYLFRQHHYHEAEEYLRQALRRLEANPLHDSGDRGHSLMWLAEILQAQGRTVEAAAARRRAEALRAQGGKS